MIFAYPFGELITPTTVTWINSVVATSGTNPTITYTERTAYRLGPLMFVYLDFTITNNNTGGGVLQCAFPTNAKHRNTLTGRNLTTGAHILGAVGSGLNIFSLTTNVGAYPGVTGHRYIIFGTYEE